MSNVSCSTNTPSPAISRTSCRATECDTSKLKLDTSKLKLDRSRWLAWDTSLTGDRGGPTLIFLPFTARDRNTRASDFGRFTNKNQTNGGRVKLRIGPSSTPFASVAGNSPSCLPDPGRNG
ncbi:hypothetical protein ACCO45_005467 [Purpureocillium lilacinum]|uniref:Uncharacterized protein n=1 Tax=Purpureocillium lilacinum TaxID=33203 RepID=A0ACC4DYE1_PURLI